ncbi:MAG: ABC transporter permease subunit [Paracoccaceae bacterium]
MRQDDGQGLRLTVLALVLIAIVAPIAAGLAKTAFVAFGHLPAIGANGPGLAPFQQLLAMPGFATSLWLTLFTGFGSTVLALVAAIGTVASLEARGRSSLRLITPILAAPHAAVAIGLAFLLAPSGWIARLLSPWATGWQVPADLAIVHDPYGLALLAGLVVKELPFLVLVLLVAMRQLPVAQNIAEGRALGYGRGQVWARVILPQLYPLIRLPVLAVLIFALSVVDMAIILGPSNPPTLAVAVTRWLNAPDLALLLPGTAGAVALALLSAVAAALWLLAERLVAHFGRIWIGRGHRGMAGSPLNRLAFGLGAGFLLTGLLSLVVLLLWSLAWRWSFPNAWPESWTMRFWQSPDMGWGPALWQSLSIGLCATILSLSLAILWLEAEDRGHLGRARWAEGLVYLPLMVPQVAFLFGLQVVFLTVGLRSGYAPVVWAHCLFVFPYVMIALSDPWRALDPRLVQTAAALGAGPWRRLYAVKLPCLLGPVAGAASIGFAVSVAQFLPTLFLGAGRITTLTTEAVALSSGADRRLTGVFGVLQTILPLMAYWLALALPATAFRHRRALRGGAS